MVDSEKDKGLHPLANVDLPEGFAVKLEKQYPTGAVDTDIGSGRTFRMICSLIGHMLAGEIVILFSHNRRHDFDHILKVVFSICRLPHTGFAVYGDRGTIEYIVNGGRIMIIDAGDRLDKFNGLRPSIFAIDHRAEEVSPPHDINRINDEMWARRHRKVTCK